MKKTSLIFLFLLILLHIMIFGVYRMEAVDEPWVISWTYNLFEKGAFVETNFGDSWTGGEQAFSKLWAYSYGFFLNNFGWTRDNAHLVSILFIFGSILLWFFILKKLQEKINLSDESIWGFLLCMAILEPWFGCAHLARMEAFCFFFVSAAFLAFLNGGYIAAGLLTSIAIESHPFSVIAFAYMASAIIAFRPGKRETLKSIASYALGGILGAAMYFSLHGWDIGTLMQVISKGQDHGLTGEIFYQYFYERAYHRHMPEFGLLVGCVLLYLKEKLYAKDSFIWIFPILCWVWSLLIGRHDYIYIIYLFPSILLLMVYTLQRRKKVLLLTAGIYLVMVPQYLFLWYTQRNFDLDTYIDQVSQAVPNTAELIVGSANNWFAFKDRNFLEANYFFGGNRGDRSIPDEAYYIEGHFSPYYIYPTVKPNVESQSMSKVGSFKHNGRDFTVYRLER